jgi:uncharacterized surface protein with fasciclin (FAS1) repeats
MAVKAVLALIALLCASVFAQSPTNTIAANVAEDPNLSELAGIVTGPGYEAVLEALSNPDATLTLFAPNNSAFEKLPAVPGYDDLINILYYHAINDIISAGNLTALQFPDSLMANASYVNLGEDKAQVLQVTQSDGVVTIVFGVPGTPAGVATVTTADVACSNGVIHIIDTVLLIPGKTSEVAAAAGLTDLIEALQLADLVSAVDDTASLTIFAPTNEAFAALGDWRSLPVETLKDVLLYHVVPAVAYSTDLSNNQKFTTLEGGEVTITTTDGVKVNDANVAVANALIKNGVVHVIDKVLMPEGDGSGSPAKFSTQVVSLVVTLAVIVTVAVLV